MKPIVVLSLLASKRMTPTEAWAHACPRLHENMGWGVVVSDALKAQPTLHPELHAIFNQVTSGDPDSIGQGFNAMQAWLQHKSTDEIALGLSIWVCQNQVEPYTVGNLVHQTPLAWRWDVALAVQDYPASLSRSEHHTLLSVLQAQRLAQEVSKGQHWEPSILSNMFGS